MKTYPAPKLRLPSDVRRSEYHRNYMILILKELGLSGSDPRAPQMMLDWLKARCA